MNIDELPAISPVETQVYDAISSYAEFEKVNKGIMQNTPIVYAALMLDPKSYPLYQVLCRVLIIQQRISGEAWEDHEPVGLHLNVEFARNTLLREAYDESVRDKGKDKNVSGGMS